MKYKFENGYTAEWRNQAINPGDTNHLTIQWTPKEPDLHELGNQFVGEYLYKFVPLLCQPIANRIKQPFPYRMNMGPYILCVLFKPNKRPKYMAGDKEMIICPANRMEDNLSDYFSKN